MLDEEEEEVVGARARNDLVDATLAVLRAGAAGRPIVFSTFDADTAVLLARKQCAWPVAYLTCGGQCVGARARVCVRGAL